MLHNILQETEITYTWEGTVQLSKDTLTTNNKSEWDIIVNTVGSMNVQT